MSGSTSLRGREWIPNPEAGYLEEPDDLVASDERQIEIARSRTVRIEWGTVLPAFAGHGAPAKHDTGAGRNGRADEVHKGVELPLVSGKCQTDDVRSFLLVAELFGGGIGSVVGHACSIARRLPLRQLRCSGFWSRTRVRTVGRASCGAVI